MATGANGSMLVTVAAKFKSRSGMLFILGVLWVAVRHKVNANEAVTAYFGLGPSPI